MAVDASGNLYIADQGAGANRIRKVTPGGTISTVAGGQSLLVGDGGPATNAQLNLPSAGVMDSGGNVYISDTGNNRIRRIAPNGIISTIAGNGTAGYSGDGGAGTSAQLNNPMGVAVDSAGNVYIADELNSTIRKVTPSGTITTLAGNGKSGFSGDGGPATSAQLNAPQGVAVDASGNVFIADTSNRRVRRVSSGGTIITVAGNGTFGFSGDGGPGINAELGTPVGLAVDTNGNLYIADQANGRIREVLLASETISTVVGSGQRGVSCAAATLSAANLDLPPGLAVVGGVCTLPAGMPTSSARPARRVALR